MLDTFTDGTTMNWQEDDAKTETGADVLELALIDNTA